MLIIGVDPGLANTGYGIIDAHGQSLKHVVHGCITTAPDMPFPDRLVHIHDAFTEVLNHYKPGLCAMESIFFAKNAKSAFQVGHARGATILTAALHDIPVYEYTPVQIKKALVGVGRADKNQVQYMTRVVLCLKETPQPDHAADALAAAVCHANSMKLRAVTGQSKHVYGQQ